MTTKEQAEQDYMAGMKYKDIAAKYDVTLNTVKSWKTRGKWVREKGAHKTKKGAHKKETVDVEDEAVEEPITDDYGLTPKERRLADEYIATGNKMQSAIKAGYSESYARTKAHVLLEKARVKQYINDCLNSMSKPKIMDAQEVLELYTSIARGELTETVVTGSLHGQDITEKEADLRTRMAAGKEIMKRYPANDVLTAAKVRKLEAEADIAEAKAKEMAIEQADIQTEIEFVFDRGDAYEED